MIVLTGTSAGSLKGDFSSPARPQACEAANVWVAIAEAVPSFKLLNIGPRHHMQVVKVCGVHRGCLWFFEILWFLIRQSLPPLTVAKAVDSSFREED
jgi:hypothetical protein